MIPLYFSLPLMLSCFFCLYRIFRGPTPADRIVAVDFLGIIVVCFCALLAYYSGQGFLMDVALAFALCGFVGTIALAKYLEGRGLGD
jgi:multicomponent Na+:H+ antiporter subunit F